MTKVNAPIAPSLLKRVIQRIVHMLSEKYDEDYPDQRKQNPRALHNKAHGMPTGTLEIGEDVPADLKIGLFAKPGSYPIHCRFSNGGSASVSDSRPDVRGLAIKVSNVVQEDREITQDFVMGNYPTFFVRNAFDMAEFIKKAGSPQTFFIGWNPLNWRLKELSNLVRCLLRGVRNPLAEQYWSQTPYKLGNLQVKFSVKPQLPKSKYLSPSSGGNFLRQNMAAHLREHDAAFDLLVQVRTAPHLEPIYDATVEWGSPMRKVGTIKIPRQIFDNDQLNLMAEKMRFSPWNTLAEHAPLGDLNLVREMVYRELAKKRSGSNAE